MHLRGLVPCLLLSLRAFGQIPGAPPPSTPSPILIGYSATTTTTIALGIPFVGIPIVPFAPVPPTVVPLRGHIVIESLAPGATYGPVKWFKNGKQLAYTAGTIEIAQASADDTGTYSCAVPGPDGTFSSSDSAYVLVSSRVGQRLINISSRTRISTAQPSFVNGFVIEPGPASSLTLLLIRAVGPALGQFGVTDPLVAPKLRLTNSAGTEIKLAPPGFYTSPATVATYVGAFPLPAGSKDVAAIYGLPAGAYSVELTSADGGSGTALVEIYEIPATVPAL